MLLDQKYQQLNSIRNLLSLKNEDQEITLYLFQASTIDMVLQTQSFFCYCSLPVCILWNEVNT